MAVPDALLASLRVALGPEGVLEDPADITPYVEDWSGTVRGSTPAVLGPGSTEEVATAVRLCHEAGVALVPQGGNTGLAGGSVPDESGGQLVLSLARLPFSFRTVNLKKGVQNEPAHLARNRYGKVPVLEHEGLTIVNSNIILDYLARTFPGSEVGLHPLALLLGESEPGARTRSLLAAFEGLVFGAGLALGLTRRPPP